MDGFSPSCKWLGPRIARSGGKAALRALAQGADSTCEEARRPKRGVPVGGGEVERGPARRDDMAGDRRNAEEDPPKKIQRRLPPTRRPAHGQPPPPIRRQVRDHPRHEEA